MGGARGAIRARARAHTCPVERIRAKDQSRPLTEKHGGESGGVRENRMVFLLRSRYLICPLGSSSSYRAPMPPFSLSVSLVYSNLEPFRLIVVHCSSTSMHVNRRFPLS